LKKNYNSLKDTILIGRKPVLDALNEQTPIEKVWIDNKLKGELESEVRFLTRQAKIPLQYVPKEKLNSIASNPMHQGIVAQLSIVDYLSIEDVLAHIYELGEMPFILVLDGVEDVRNLGALARSAVWFGVHAIVVSLKKSARINSFAYKASAGAIKDITICRETSIIKALEYMKQSGLQLVVADVSENDSDKKPNFLEPTALIMGSEEKGVVREIAEMADSFIRIEGTGKIESLNVSVAGAILMHEIFKSRNLKDAI
jgi:23S rRNA (guanosine2251-2'-O)-methyltransferase